MKIRHYLIQQNKQIQIKYYYRANNSSSAVQQLHCWLRVTVDFWAIKQNSPAFPEFLIDSSHMNLAAVPLKHKVFTECKPGQFHTFMHETETSLMCTTGVFQKAGLVTSLRKLTPRLVKLREREMKEILSFYQSPPHRSTKTELLHAWLGGFSDWRGFLSNEVPSKEKSFPFIWFSFFPISLQMQQLTCVLLFQPSILGESVHTQCTWYSGPD